MRATRQGHLAGGATALACAATALALGGPALGQQLQEAVGIRLAANEASAKSQKTIDGLSDETDKLLGQYRQVLGQIADLREYNRQVSELIASQEEEMASLRDQIDEVSLVGRQVTPHMLEMIDALETFVELDVPFLLEERTNRVTGLRDLMARADVANAEKYRRIMEAYQIENEFGRTIEAYQGTLDAEGDSRTVDFLRVGRIALVYRTLDGSEAGVWDQKNQRWVALDDSFRSSIREGLQIARKQTAPRLIQLPVAAPEDAR